jgi:deoxyribodipyrimidine photolyase
MDELEQLDAMQRFVRRWIPDAASVLRECVDEQRELSRTELGIYPLRRITLSAV